LNEIFNKNEVYQEEKYMDYKNDIIIKKTGERISKIDAKEEQKEVNDEVAEPKAKFIEST
jgi:hypothetical protein